MWADPNKKAAQEALFAHYHEYHGQDPYAICRRLRIIIIRSDHIERNNAYFSRSHNDQYKMIWKIELPTSAFSPEFECMALFHELAHYFVRHLTPQYEKLHEKPPYTEAYCDNFALAMLFAQHDHPLPLMSNICYAENFFEQGIGLKRCPETESDIFLGKRILFYFINPNQLNLPFEREPVFNLPTGVHPLIDLARLLINEKPK